MKSRILENREFPTSKSTLRLTNLGARVRAIEESFPSASKGLLSIVDQAIVSGTNFLTAALIGRMTSPEHLGLYYLVLSIVLIVTGIQEQVITAPYTVYSKRRRGRDLAEYGGSMWLHQALLTALLIVALATAIVVCIAIGSAAILPGLWALVGAGPLLLLRQSIRRFSFANLHVRSAIGLDAIVAVSQLGGLALLGHFGWLSLFGIYAVMGGASGLACVGWYLLDRPQVRFIPHRALPDWRHNWKFGKWALRSYLVGSTTPQVMIWIVSLAVGAAATGVLGACATLVGMSNVILMGVDNILTPQAAHAYATRGSKDLRRILTQTIVFLSAVLGGFCILVLLTGDWLMVFVFGSFYEGSGAILLALAVNALMTALGLVAGNGLYALDRPRSNFIADVAGMVLAVIVASLLIFPLGAFGAALATLAGTSAASILRTITLKYYLDRESPEVCAEPRESVDRATRMMPMTSSEKYSRADDVSHLVNAPEVIG